MEDNCKSNSGPKTAREFFRSWSFWRPFLGVVLGGVAGLLYFHFVGCSSGTCPLTGSAWGATIAGSLLGFMVTSSPCSKC